MLGTFLPLAAKAARPFRACITSSAAQAHVLKMPRTTSSCHFLIAMPDHQNDGGMVGFSASQTFSCFLSDATRSSRTFLFSSEAPIAGNQKFHKNVMSASMTISSGSVHTSEGGARSSSDTWSAVLLGGGAGWVYTVV